MVQQQELHSETGKIVLYLFWSIMASLILLSAIFIVIYLLPLNPKVKEIFIGLGMIIIGAVIASIIHEVILGAYYKHQSKQIIVESLSPNLLDVKNTVDKAVPQIVTQVTEKTTKSIENIKNRVAEASDFMLNGISVLQGAKACGIVNIFRTRYDDCVGVQDTKHTLLKDIQAETAVVRLMGISLGDYFLDRGVLNSDLISFLEKSKSDSDKPKIQALLVHPKCKALRERARWEAGADYYSEEAFYDSTTFIETDGAARIAKRLCQKYKSLEVRLYSQAPTAFLLITSRFLFYEPYNYSARGSKVPLIQVQAGVQLYKHYETHFSRIWGVAEPIANFDSIKEKEKNDV